MTTTDTNTNADCSAYEIDDMFLQNKKYIDKFLTSKNLSNKQKRSLLINIFNTRPQYMPLDDDFKQILNLFVEYKEAIEEHKNEDLFFFDSGHDYGVDWGIGYYKYFDKMQVTSTIASYKSKDLKEEILELYPKSDEEIKLELSRMKKPNHKFNFGKYKGQHIVDIIEKDYSYMQWCCREVEGFKKYLRRISKKIEDYQNATIKLQSYTHIKLNTKTTSNKIKNEIVAAN
jgi:uncharacterized protein (DUF3820 family)